MVFFQRKTAAHTVSESAPALVEITLRILNVLTDNTASSDAELRFVEVVLAFAATL